MIALPSWSNCFKIAKPAASSQCTKWVVDRLRCASVQCSFAMLDNKCSLLFNSSYMINQYSSRRHQLAYTEAMLLNALFESSKIISLLDSAQWMKHSLCTYGINFWHKLNWLSTCSAVHEWIQNLLPGNNCIASLATMQHCLDLPAHESWYMTNCRTVVLGHLMDKIPGTLVCHWITIAVTLFGCGIHVMNGKPTLSPGSRNRSQC
jgi:hypothetical protein